MRLSRTVQILLLALALGSPLAAAQTPGDDAATRLTLARQVVAMRSEASEMQLFHAKLPFYVGTLQASAHLTDAERAALPQLLEQQFRAALPPEHEHVAATYARLFTADQLRSVLAFYASDAGRAFLLHQEDLTQDGIALQRVFDAAVLAGTAHVIEDQRAATPQ